MSTRHISLMGSGLMMKRLELLDKRRRSNSTDRWSQKPSLLRNGLKLTFTDTSVNFDVHYRVFGSGLASLSLTGVVSGRLRAR